MKNYYEMIKNKILDNAWGIDAGLYYTVEEYGIDISSWIKDKSVEYAVQAVESLIYKNDTGMIEEDIQKIENYFNFDNLELSDKVDKVFRLVKYLSECIEDDVIQDDESLGVIYKQAERIGMLFLWYEYIFKTAKKFLLIKKKCV